ncbi:class I SAM-dependent methyltransferase [Xanthomarina sp.]|uniref:class I SAM-dependent methyltransferase n=1 Tax=Xanthomarina sp. TaxID=1931211 RepID=UPI002BCB901D|nr:hypothetical protein [Xanthomarina sp.]HLV40377.1 hypothetical protein [Xanthomarina sp.]
MAFNIKKKLQVYIKDRITEIGKNQQQTQQVVLDYAQISRLFPEPNFIPYTAWSISPSVILHVLNDIVINKRLNIIEFGAGASTLYIAQLIKTLKLPTKLYSVESDQEWLTKMQNDILRFDLTDIVTFIYAPLTAVVEGLGLGEQKLWYDSEKITDDLPNEQEFDLVIVDGPFGGGTPYARYSAIPFIKDRLSEEYGVFLDDTQRKDEQEITGLWGQVLGVKPQCFQRYTYFKSSKSFDTTPYMISNF